jgi:adenine nucleotide transporter 17
VYKNEGIWAFYKGVLPNMILVLNPMINFVIYESLKKDLVKNKIMLSALHLLLISSISKAVATIFTYPMLTIRVKL